MEEEQNSFLNEIESRDNTEALEKAKKDLAMHEHAYEEFKKEMALQIAINDVVKKNPKPLELTHEFQKDPEFWELNKQLNDIAFNRKMNEMQMRIDKSQEIIDIKRAEVARLAGE